MSCSNNKAPDAPSAEPVEVQINERRLLKDADGNIILGVACRDREKNAICTKEWTDANGNVIDPRLALVEFGNQHRIKYGGLTIPSIKRLKGKSPDERVRALIFGQNLSSETLTQKQEDVWIFEGSVAELREVAKMEDVTTVHFSEGMGGELANATTAAAESMAVYTKTFGRQNDLGIYGEGQRVGLMELMGNGCKIRDDHNAFANMNLIYEDSNFTTCNSSNDCELLTNVEHCYFSGSGGCVDNRCVGAHATAVSSRIGATFASDLHHAAAIDLYVANNWDSTHPTYLNDRYEWFRSQEVSLINESITFTEEADVESATGVFGPSIKDVLADFYARRYNMTFVSAAGNLDQWDQGDTQVLCHQINGICVGSTDHDGTLGNGTTLGSEYLDDFISPFQRWKNPGYNLNSGGGLSGLQSDIERPDLVSNGENVYVADYTTKDEWKIESGTSFSAPVITGMIALEKERCAGKLPDRPHFWRSRLRNQGFTPHRLETSAPSFYPDVMNGGGYDWKGGAGIPIARGGTEECESDEPGENGSGWTSFEDVVSEGNWSEPPEWMITSDIDPTQYHSTWETVAGLKVIKTNNAGDPLPHKVLHVKTIEGHQGSDLRIRASLSFMNCFTTTRRVSSIILGQNLNVSAGTLNTDYLGDLSAWVTFDFVLCGDDTETCYAASTATWDNNEGFDIILPENPSDELSMYVVAQWDETAGGPLFACPAGEPMSIHWLWRTL